jgi:outer membrane protein TolC
MSWRSSSTGPWGNSWSWAASLLSTRSWAFAFPVSWPLFSGGRST